MAEENSQPAEENSGGGGSGSMMKALILLVGVLLLEGATVGVTIYLAGGPAPVEGVGLSPDQMAAQERLVEIKVIDDRFSNVRTGRHYQYMTVVYITVRQRDQEVVEEILESQKASILVDVQTIIRRALPSVFEEEERKTLQRQFRDILDKRLGRDDEGHSLINQVLITKCDPFRVDT